MFMLRSTHRQIYVKQGEAYRREIEESKAEARQAREQLREFTKGMVLSAHADQKAYPYPPGTRTVLMIEVHDWMRQRDTPQELTRYVTQEILSQLASIRHTDPRPDMRDPEGRRFDPLRGMGPAVLA